jgi:hypothetical protein
MSTNNNQPQSPLEYPANDQVPVRIFRRNRAPLTTDYRNFKVRDFWNDTSSDDLWYLTSKTTTSGVWIKLGGATTGDVQFLAGDSGGNIPPDGSGVVGVLGGTNVNTSGAGSNATVNLDANVLGLTQLTVDNLELNGNTLSSTDVNGDVIIAPNGSGTISVTAAPIVPSTDRADSLGSATNSWDNVYADGLTFDDGSNIMSAYETGTWTPVLKFGGETTGIEYSTQEGHYTRIGNIVYIGFRVSLTSKGSETGAATITGLPFTPATLSEYSSACGFANINLGVGYTSVFAGVRGAVGDVLLSRSGDNKIFNSVTDTEFTSGTLLNQTIFYFV